MTLRFRGTVVIIAVAAVVIGLTAGKFGSLRGYVAWNDPSLTKMLAIGDRDADGGLSVPELRRTLIAVIQRVVAPPPNPDAIPPYDIDSNGALERADIRRTVTVIRDLLGAVCGNGSIDSGEQCDDGGTASADGCSATCRIESGYVCSGTPSTCMCQDASCGGNTIRVVESGSGDLLTGMAYGTDGFPIMTYGFRDQDGVTFMKIAKCTDATCSGEIITSMPSTVRFVTFQSPILMGSDGLPVIAFAGMGPNNLHVLHCGNQSCTSGNTLTNLSDTGISTEADFIDMAIGTDGFPILVFNEQQFRNSTLEYKLEVVHCGNITCSANNTLSVLQTSSRDFGGYYDPNIEIGFDGKPVIAYAKSPTGGNVIHLNFIQCTDATCTAASAPLTLSAGSRVFNPSLVLAADHFPAISFIEDSASGFKARYIKCRNADCTSVNTTVNLGQGETTASLAIGTDGTPVIATGTVGIPLSLIVYHCANADCTGTIQSATVDASVDARSPFMLMSPQGLPAISYGTWPKQKVRFALCRTATCQ